MNMELVELFSALDKAVADVSIKKKAADDQNNLSVSSIANAKNELASLIESENAKLQKVNSDLEYAIANARQLQEELQAKTTGFLAQSNVKTI